MIVINSVINNSLELGFDQSRLLDESLAQMGIEKYIIVSLLPRLLLELEANKGKDIILSLIFLLYFHISITDF